jgi:4-hydroxymandelate synthase
MSKVSSLEPTADRGPAVAGAAGRARHPARLDHIGFAVSDLDGTVDELVGRQGFAVDDTGDPRATDHRVAVLRQGDIVITVTEGRAGHPAAAYVAAHGDGVADIALACADVRAAFASAVAAGARELASPRVVGGVRTAAIAGFGDVRHTFVERPDLAGPAAASPRRPAAPRTARAAPTGLRSLDHIAVCVEAGQLDATVAFYAAVLGFTEIFKETIVVGGQAMRSCAIRNPAGDVTLTVIEPDTSRAPGQIDAFIDHHGGTGVQHLAFATDDIVATVGTLRRRGVDFLATPASYYATLADRVDVTGHSVAQLRELAILADSDHAGQLYQIFTRSTHPRDTYFMEVIERRGAETFGSGNIKALYAAVERDRQRREPAR